MKTDLKNYNPELKKAAKMFAISGLGFSLEASMMKQQILQRFKKKFIEAYIAQFKENPSDCVLAFWQKYHDVKEELEF